MHFRQLYDSVSSTYTYLLACRESGEAVLIDPVFEKHTRDSALIRELGLRLVAVLETHVHADHVTAAWRFKQALEAKIVYSDRAGVRGADVLVGHGDIIHFGGRHLEARATPGHTDGCTTFVLDDQSMAFTGDALMIRGAGRTDFQQGSASTLYHSIREQIFTLPPDCRIYPAHDYAGRTATTVHEEVEHNPRVGGHASEADFVGYMDNLGLPHPKKLDVAVPANLLCGKPREGALPPAPSWGPVVTTYAGVPEIDPVWVSEHRHAVHLLDVRESHELTGELGSLTEIQHIPLGMLRERVASVPDDRPVVTICRSGKRSAQAVVILRKAGRTELANMQGGMLRWRALELPTTPA